MTAGDQCLRDIAMRGAGEPGADTAAELVGLDAGKRDLALAEKGNERRARRFGLLAFLGAFAAKLRCVDARETDMRLDRLPESDARPDHQRIAVDDAHDLRFDRPRQPLGGRGGRARKRSGNNEGSEIRTHDGTGTGNKVPKWTLFLFFTIRSGRLQAQPRPMRRVSRC